MYIVTMYRYGDREKHSYVLGAWSDKAEAEKWGDIEDWWRGGKYKPEIQLATPNVAIEYGTPGTNAEREEYWKQAKPIQEEK